MKKDDKVSFYGVSLAFIILGAIIFVFGLVAWYISAIGGETVMAFPFFKLIGGLIVMSLGYIQLQLEIMRQK